MQAATWSPDGSTVAVTTDDGLQLLDPTTMDLGAAMPGHTGAVMDAQFAGTEGDLLWTAGRDGTAVGFDLSGRRAPITTRPADPSPHVGASSATAERGVYLAVLDNDPNKAYVTDLASGRNLGELVLDVARETTGWPTGVEFQATAVAITKDGSTGLVGVEAFVRSTGGITDHGAVALFDVATQRQLAVVELPWPVTGVAVTPRGDRAIVNGHSGYVVLDLAARRLVGGATPLAEAEWTDWTSGAEVSPDGRLAALAHNDEVVMVDARTGELLLRGVIGDAGDWVQGLAWSADSTTLAVGMGAGWLHVVSAEDLRPVAPPRLVTGGVMPDLEMSPDGRTMASIGSDGDVTLWDTRTWRPYGAPVVDKGEWGWLTYSPDGRTLRVFYRGGEVVEVSADPTDWVRAACVAAGRNLTPEETAVILPGQPVEPTCPEPT